MKDDAGPDETRGAPAAPRAGDETRCPATMLETRGWDGYRLLDAGAGRKLEQFGAKTLIRPEPQAIWAPTLAPSEWSRADAVFDAAVEDDEHGRWRVEKGDGAAWAAPCGDLSFECRFSAFRHVGIFPEQAPHWEFMQDLIRARRASGRTFRLLNLFGYTGAASLIAAAEGADVVHVDASKKAIDWARTNQTLNALDEKPIRWLCDDAMKFAARETRRGNRYDGILLDPPKFGRGPKNEVWRLFEDLPAMIRLCAELLADDAAFLILTAYALRLSYVSLYELMRDATARRGGDIAAGELVLRDEAGGRFLSTSLYARWSAS
jgi:23S rRNA (cytosine1962-C5)-methyltransferase